jgi:glycosyl transferase, family 25
MSPLSDYFGLTRVVNVPARTDRFREISDQLHALQTPFTDGKVELFPAICPQEAAGFTNAAARGCYMSHLEILRDARSRSVETVLMIEDDLYVRPRHVPLLHAVAQRLADHSWGIVYLGHTWEMGHTYEMAQADAALMPFDGDLTTSHFYVVHRTVFDRLIAYLEICLTRPPGDPLGGPMEYDGALNMFRRAHPEVVTLLAQPSLGSQRPSRSDIHPSRFEGIPGIHLARRVKRLLLN